MTDTQIRHLSDLPPFDPFAAPVSFLDDAGLEMVRVLVTLRDQNTHAGEALWATPVCIEADGFGKYVLRNNGITVSLRLGDVVLAEPGSDSHLRVTGIAHLADGLLTEVLCPDDAPTADIEQTLGAWYAGGALYTEPVPGILVTAWPDSMSQSEVLAVLERTTPPGWSLWDMPTAVERAVQLINDVDFGVDLSLPIAAIDGDPT